MERDGETVESLGLSNGPALGDDTVCCMRTLALRGLFAAILLAGCSSDDEETQASDANQMGTIGGPEAGMSQWPSPGNSGERIDGPLLAEYPGVEPSGLAYDLNSDSAFVVSDDGRLFQIDNGGGEVLGHWNVGGDPESLALDGDRGLLFIGFEGRSEIRAWSLFGQPFHSHAFCTLDIFVDGNRGFEALTYVPQGEAPESWGRDPFGFLVAGTQASRNLFVYPASSCKDGARLSALDDETTGGLVTAGREVSGLDYDARVGFLALSDKGNTLTIMTTGGDVVSTHNLPDGDLEGVSIGPVDCANGVSTITIADDKGKLRRWDDFPVDCE